MIKSMKISAKSERLETTCKIILKHTVVVKIYLLIRHHIRTVRIKIIKDMKKKSAQRSLMIVVQLKRVLLHLIVNLILGLTKVQLKLILKQLKPNLIRMSIYKVVLQTRTISQRCSQVLLFRLKRLSPIILMNRVLVPVCKNIHLRKILISHQRNLSNVRTTVLNRISCTSLRLN